MTPAAFPAGQRGRSRLHSVEAGAFSGGVEADGQPVDFSGPAVDAGLLDAVAQIGDDLYQTGTGTTVDTQARASDACECV